MFRTNPFFSIFTSCTEDGPRGFSTCLYKPTTVHGAISLPCTDTMVMTSYLVGPTEYEPQNCRLVIKVYLSGFGGLEVACWPLVPKFEGSNPAEAVGFFRAKKSSARLPSEGK